MTKHQAKILELSAELQDARVRIAQLEAELLAVKQQAVEIARGCTDYGGGHRGNHSCGQSHLEIYHHGMQTVENSLKAWASGDNSYQLRVVQSIGKEALQDAG